MTDEQSVMPEPTPPVQADSGLSFKGLWQVLVSPGEFFEKLKDNPKTLLAYLVYVSCAALFFVAVGDYLLEIQMKVLEAQGQPTAQMPQHVMKMFMVGGGVISIGLIPLVTAAFAMFFGNVFMEGRAKFKQLLSVALYSGFIYALGFLAVIPLVYAKDSAMVSYSLATFVADQGMQSVSYQVLSKVGLFYIWEFIVAGIGFAKIYNWSTNKGMVLAALSLGLLSLLHVASTVLGSAFGPQG